MILKASQRGGGKQLASHLTRIDDNEHVEVHEIRGFVSDDIHGAMKEAYTCSLGTRCRQFLFSVSLNPPESENVPIDVFENAVERIEEKNGLTGQPRIVVFHEKEGRRHAHVVWSRIDAEEMKAINLPHYKLRLRDISKELYLENEWQLPKGLMDSKTRDPRNFTLAEWQQSKRLGRNARDLKAMMQECWAASDSRQAFATALEARGLYLARGDRRGHVAVTHEGEVLSVARYTGKKAKDIRARLGEPDDLRSIQDTKSHIAQAMTPAMQQHLETAKKAQVREKAHLDRKRLEMTELHRTERAKLDDGQQQRWIEETKARSKRINGGLRGLWDKLTGTAARIRKENEQQTFEALQRDREQRQHLIDTQMQNRHALQLQIREMCQRHADQLADLRTDIEQYQDMQKRDDVSELKARFNDRAIMDAALQSYEERTPDNYAEQKKGKTEATQAHSRPSIPTPKNRIIGMRMMEPRPRHENRDMDHER